MSRPQKRGGKWRIQWIDARGRRRSETYPTRGTAAAALARRQTEVADIRAGRARPRSEQTVREASKEWLATRPPSRHRDNERDLRLHVLPFMGDRTLPELTPDLVQRFIRHLETKTTARPGERNEEGRTLKPATINNVLVTLRKMLNDLDYPIRVRYKVPTADYSWIKTPAEVARFLEACGDGWFRVAAELAVYAGLRKGEVAGLLWDAIDFDRGMVRVDRSYDGPTKSRHQRYVPLAPELAATLKRWRLRRPGRQVVRADGQAMRSATDVARRTARACKRAGVAKVTFHELRDTYASHLAERVSLPIVGAVLGHADPKTTARYAHIDTESLARDPRLHLTFAPALGKVLPLRTAECTSGAPAGAETEPRPMEVAENRRSPM